MVALEQGRTSEVMIDNLKQDVERLGRHLGEQVRSHLRQSRKPTGRRSGIRAERGRQG